MPVKPVQKVYSRIKNGVIDATSTVIANNFMRGKSNKNKASYWNRAADAMKADRQRRQNGEELDINAADMTTKPFQDRVVADKARKELKTGKDMFGKDINTKRYRRSNGDY